MTRTNRRLMVSLMLAGLAGSARTLAADGLAASHVRSSNSVIVALIQRASQESETFRRLVESINASDGIVYVEDGQCRAGARACFVTVTKPGAHRFLWVKIDLSKARADWDAMGSIAHELRHTLEVLSNEAVTSAAEMYLFYLRVGWDRSSGFETQAAIDAGITVRAQVRKCRTQAHVH